MTSRRLFLQSAAGLLVSPFLAVHAAAGSRPTGPAPGIPLPRTDDGLCALSAHDAVALMKSGELRAEHYAAALLSRADSRKDLNAFISLDPGRVMDAARRADRNRRAAGLLHGLPIPVKDSVLTLDYSTTAGTGGFGPLAPRRDAPIVQRLKRQGAIVLGKTNLHELSSGFTSNNEIFGAVHNPWNVARIPGGSSGGTAAAIAGGMAPLGVAEDTAGSIRVPAALCGVYGFRPTVGRYPAGDIAPLVPIFDTPGPQARNMRDIVLFDAAVTGKPGDLKSRSLNGVRLGVPRAYFYEGVESSVAVVMDNTLLALRDAGAVLVERDIPDAKTLLDQTFAPILFHDTWGVLDAWFKSHGIAGGLDAILLKAGKRTRDQYLDTLKPGAPGAIPEAAYRNAMETARPALLHTVRQYFADNRLDAVVYPQTLCTAPLIGEDDSTDIDGRKVSIFDALGHTTVLASSCAMPALTIPAGLSAKTGLPVGFEMAALPGADETLLSLGLGVQEMSFT